jgi:unconventional prefoldin RPB5 interactor 1
LFGFLLQESTTDVNSFTLRTMVQNVKDSFLDLERHRQMLEENIEKLQKSLRHWQTWEAEYEGLKEEILAADPTPNRQQLVALAREYDGQLVNKKEIEEILGAETRDAAQVVNLLDRRIDYVEKNVRTVQRQIETAENKLAAATIISTPDVRNEEGLPLTEIVEELDEEGNVISSHTSTPGSAKPQLLEVLRKAGVKDLPSLSTAPDSSSQPAIDNMVEKPAEKAIEKPAEKAFAKPSEKAIEKTVDAPEAAVNPAKKGVKFTEDTKDGPEPEMSRNAKRLEEIMNIAKQSEEKPSEPPIIPTNESPEDAALRREMLQYGLSEVGAVVAELNLEDGSDWSDEDYSDEESSTDDEDQYGRSTRMVVDDDLRQRMIELEERLGVRMMENIGKKASDYDLVREGIGRVTINRKDDGSAQKDSQVAPVQDGQNANDDSPSATTSTKKSVRFSEDLDISPAPKPPAAAPTPTPKKVQSAPIGDIVERTAPVESSAPVPKKKTSRFKSDRASAPTVSNGPLALPKATPSGPSLPLFPAKPSKPKPFSQPIKFAPVGEQPRTVPTGPEGMTLAPTIVERDVPLDTSVPEPDELDPQLLHQEVATEYHRMRNRMIQRQGGFMKEDESEVVPFSEEEGGPKKMSRFKAARLARS